MEKELIKELILETEVRIIKLVAKVLEEVDDSDSVIMLVNDAGYTEYVIDIFLGHILVQRLDIPVTPEEVKESYICPQCGIAHVGNFYTVKLPNY